MSATTHIPLGATATWTIEVTRDLTVAHFEPGMPEVFGTPMMIFLMETAAATAIQKHLPDGWVSVGTGVNIKHLAATPVGCMVTATAKVLSTDHDSVTFVVEAHDGVEKIGEGTHVRAAIDLARFKKRMTLKSAAPRAAKT